MLITLLDLGYCSLASLELVGSSAVYRPLLSLREKLSSLLKFYFWLFNALLRFEYGVLVHLVSHPPGYSVLVLYKISYFLKDVSCEISCVSGRQQR